MIRKSRVLSGVKKVVHYMPSDWPLFRNTKAGWLNENFGRILVYEFLIFLFGRVGSLKDVKCRYKLIELTFQFFLKQV